MITSKDQDLTSNPQIGLHLLEKQSLSDNPSKDPTTQESNLIEEIWANGESAAAAETKQLAQQGAKDAPRTP